MGSVLGGPGAEGEDRCFATNNVEHLVIIKCPLRLEVYSINLPVICSYRDTE